MSRLPSRPFLYAIVDLALLAGRSIDEVVRALIAGGAGLLQVRGKEATDRDLLEAVRRACDAARPAAVPVLVNDRPDVALLAGAGGVHVGQDDLPAAACRRLLGPAALVGGSTHTLGQVDALADGPLDYIAVGPVFATTTKAPPDPVVGTELVAAARARTRLPLVGIGGITPDNAGAVVAAGAAGVAAIAALLGGDDVGARARALRRALDAA